MPASRGPLLSIAALFVGLGAVAGAGAAAGGDAPRAQPAAERVTVYSSLPLQGAARPLTTAVVNGIRLALAEAGGRAGPFRVRHVSLDDSTARAGTWTPERVFANARRAAMDSSTIAYIGEFNSGASAISIPVLNDAGEGEAVVQISPSNTANGLTVDEPGSDRGEPEKYYPTGVRSYLRLVARDTYEGAALAALMGRRGCARAALVGDGELYAQGIAGGVKRFARRHGVLLVWKGRMRPGRSDYGELARRIRRRGPRCVAFAGITANGAVQLFRDLNRAMPRARLFGPSGLFESGFSDRSLGGVSRRVGRRTLVVSQPLAPSAYPPAGRAFFARYVGTYGRRALDPYAIYGYEAMQLVLDTVGRLGTRGSNRGAVRRALFATRERESVLGTYSFTASGDTSLAEFGAYRPRPDGSFRFVTVVRP
jgi:branched-chain amino acid transport system substrate-binding protein